METNNTHRRVFYLHKEKEAADTTKAMATTHLPEVLATKYKKGEENVKSHITKAVAVASPVRLMRIKNSIPTPPNALPRKYTPEEALALFIDLGLTKKKYIILRKSLLQRNADILPGYKKITQAKKEAVPLSPKMTEVSADIKLQNLMDHTSTRLLQSFTEGKLKSLPKELALITKWDCDRSSVQSAYKQRINVDDETITDSNMFMASIVPLRLKDEASEYWKNPPPSSTILCRPILFQYEQESSELIKATVSDIKNQNAILEPTIIEIEEGNVIKIKHDLLLTMVDGKVLNLITNTTSTMKYPICKSQKDFENVDDSITDELNYEYGISPLHARIRCMEFVLKLAYTLPQQGEVFVDNTTCKEKQNRRKKIIQDAFYKEIGLRVDCPKYECGNTNDGNFLRRFFENDEVTAHITKVDRDIVK
ncbi:uncharacterized protein [Eurosta solidaginis]|uniref:uncharacterized protein isoform X1 n=1 Tax=Eurosta solidaginis TaxID=178769 RepID=UPI00353059A7